MRALITGGTAGIGATFARHLASRGDDLVLVARDETRLAEAAAELSRTYGVDVQTLRADLADRGDTQRVADRLLSDDDPIDLLVNNAGFGLRTTMLGEDTSEDERALDVMCRGVLVLANAAARAMTARGHGQIINTASAAGFVAMGHYSAVKAWVTAYTESMAVQLAGTGVTTTALCPGWVRTEFHDRAGINASSIPDAAWIDPDALVRECLQDVARGKVVSVPTPQWSTAIGLARVAPRPIIRWVSRKLTSKRH
ncbi:SDR family NAD(P)-dependent oxidoreductase [Mariniluteicoccus flavus]